MIDFGDEVAWSPSYGIKGIPMFPDKKEGIISLIIDYEGKDIGLLDLIIPGMTGKLELARLSR